MPRKSGKKMSQKRRRLQPAISLNTAAAMGALAANLATRGNRRGRPRSTPPPTAVPASVRGNLRGTRNRPPVITRRHANTEGYIAPYSKIIGSPETSLSLSDQVQRIMNPPQTLLYNSSGKIEATSGTQTTTHFTVNNLYWNDFFAFIAALRSDVSTVSNANYASTQVANRVNHHWTSILHTFMNSGTLTAELDIYVYQAVQDIDSGDNAVNINAAWQYAEQINGANGVAVDGTQTLAKKPTDFSSNQYISRYWKLLSNSSVAIKPGESFKHYFRKYYNRQMAQYMLNGDTSAAIRKHSISILYVLKGQVVGSSLNTDVSTGDAQISFVRNVKTQFSYAVNNRTRDLTIGSSLPVIAPANQIYVNTDTSAQVTGFTEDP